MENSKENLDYEQTMNFRTIKAHYTHSRKITFQYQKSDKALLHGGISI